MEPCSRQLSCLCLVFFISITCRSVESFSITKHQSSHCRRRDVLPLQRRSLTLTTLLDSAKSVSFNAEAVYSHQDKNGNDISADSIVQVAASGIKAYQVHKSAYGSFNDEKEFVYSSEAKYLLIPEGLRGQVIRVYDENVIGANFPILVKFVPGEHCSDDGCDTPVPFTMHFLPEEVEAVQA